MTVFNFPGHALLGTRAAPCDCSKHGGEPCFVCTGALAFCVVCRGAEGSLPAHCPGTPMTSAQQDAVYAGALQYHAARGWYETELGRQLRLQNERSKV